MVDLYTEIYPELLPEMDLSYLKKDKFSHPKYCVKMATGTGKTWVMNALLIWQYLNSKYEETPSGRYSKNFLLVAPGLIVYERLLDAYLGKQQPDGARNFDNSDFKRFETLFIPPAYRDEIYGFVQSNVVNKTEIGRKTTGDGLIAITNWHLLAGVDEEDRNTNISPLENPSIAVKELFPVTPGTSAGHALDSLDSQYLSGGELEYLASLDELVVFNDEAHHIHETKSAGIVSEVEWQKSLNEIAESKESKFIQIDFSATPYDVTGSGQKRTKHYFPHIVVDFDLYTAIHDGLVKTITLDKRKEIATLELDFRAVRDGKKVVGLSDGQRMMLRAGLKKLEILDEQFTELTKDKNGVSNKHPKMLVMCEDTNVSPLVTKFLESEGLYEDDVVQIDSDSKGTVPAKKWEKIKQRLFNIDQYESPKVIVSVLMLREGFDVNNICVIVPLRSTQSPILLEQTIGRGLRLMWREPEFEEIKVENRINLLQKKEAPSNYLDILSIIEHPAFIEFYDNLIDEGLVGETDELPTDREKILGDIIRVGLKENYKDYDLFWPVILMDKKETLKVMEPSADYLTGFEWYSLERLKKMVPKGGETFFSEEMTVKIRFGDYKVTADLFTAKSYNEFLSKIVAVVTSSVVKIGRRKAKDFPVMQINQVALVSLIDDFIRNKLFKEPFDPFVDDNWRVLLLSQAGITQHILKEISKSIYEMQNNIDVEDAVVVKRYFSTVPELRMRDNYSLELVKTIYKKLTYPSNKGELEKNFMLFCDSDSEVKAFLKISEGYHDFAHINYIRTDETLAFYFPDFIVKNHDKIYLVETKAQKDLRDENVLQKQRGALDWLKKVNELSPEDRDSCEWAYVLLGEETFYNMKDRGASAAEILEYSKLAKEKVEGRLF